ncbi:dTDP-4-dehydrorhamnose reductase [Polaribacter sp. Hel1_33_49]|jgi:dTDP-4-dehydrorhamnose reductase|uniref:dTDP-4-dehydrorhamnose reductase n=1 Tax=Polaribacter sp. Hel1_33_49 TaxID=1336803 RepID=UPI00052B7E43|nr:dTDP-4-dehydrorhamnose reductase [Polaribacter sp. Hel1_33_49]KGL60292.1 dTDP-4-dehydrorhamnose reductase [Polaribacter sp. Hel1_33_49]
MNNINILVTGGNGQLGSELKELEIKFPQYHFVFTDVEMLDICNHQAVASFIEVNQITTIINCAAYTAVDKAEEQFELADKINHLAVANFAQIARDKNIQLVHISTDYVFDGTSHKPYTETVTPNPRSVYGKTKLDGELAMQKINPKNSIIIRTSWVYSQFGNNFVKTMLRLGKAHKKLSVVADQIGTPTNAADLAKAILTILPKINNKTVDLFHYSNEGICSWYDFANTIFQIEGLSVRLTPIETKDYPTPAERPFYSVLNKRKIKEVYKITIPYWRDSLISVL